jgi:hypothetical protein
MGPYSQYPGMSGFHSIENHVFVRHEKGNKILTPHEIVNHSYAKGFQRAERELIDLDFNLIRTDFFEEVAEPVADQRRRH